MEIKTPHPHAGFIFEWTQDISRKIETHERGVNLHSKWHKVPITFVLQDLKGELVFRFAPPKPDIVSSLTDEELYAIADANNPCQEDINCSAIRAIANAAAQRAIEDLEIPKKWLEKNYSESRLFLIVSTGITNYLAALKAGELNCHYRKSPTRLTPYC